MHRYNTPLWNNTFNFAHLMHTKHDNNEYMLLFFRANIEGHAPQNQLVDQYDALEFFQPKALPENTIPTHEQAITCLQQNIPYSQYGWDIKELSLIKASV